MKKMLVLAMTMAMVLLAAAGVCETLRVGMECNYAPYNWTQSDASENAVAIAAGGYADGYDVRIAKIIADKLGMDLEIVKTEWDGLTPALLSGNIDVIIAGMSPTAERRMTIDFTDSYYDTELTVVVRKDSAFAAAKSLADLAGAKITGQMSTFHYDMIDQIEGAVKMPAMETFPTMIVAVSSGAIDGYVADRPGAVSADFREPGSDLCHLRRGSGLHRFPGRRADCRRREAGQRAEGADQRDSRGYFRRRAQRHHGRGCAGSAAERVSKVDAKDCRVRPAAFLRTVGEIVGALPQAPPRT